MSGLAILYALFVWWFSTGLILFLNHRPPSTYKWSMLGGTVVLVGALVALASSRDDVSTAGAACAFTCGVLAWGWQEMSFFMGVLTGPRRVSRDAAAGPWRHFWHAVQTCLHHELAIALCGALIVAVTWGGSNQVGTWTYVTLWAMRQSAKLNVHFGVRNLAESFLPPRLTYLRDYMRQRRCNALFPVSIIVSTGVLVGLLRRPDAGAFGPTLIATMLALAIIEHWFLVLPLPFAALWEWIIRRRPSRGPVTAQIPTVPANA